MLEERALRRCCRSWRSNKEVLQELWRSVSTSNKELLQELEEQ
jgi:hypothetical protein